jgi:hypothetical protein
LASLLLKLFVDVRDFLFGASGVRVPGTATGRRQNQQDENQKNTGLNSSKHGISSLNVSLHSVHDVPWLGH